ncbi:DUF3820 family protein [Boseaceae bacterium BT-24-1]|nr:DUF3820 family protein [Boseaceae bacterium BT-24-1]
MLVRVIDVETTGFPPDAAVCEVGWTDLIIDGSDIEIRPTLSRLCNPGRPMPEQAFKVHGISDDMLAGAPSPDVIFAEVMTGADAFCAHNCEFEKNFFGGGEKPWCCTYKVSLVAAPDAESHKNALLPALLGITLDPSLAEPAHRAGPDTYVTAHLLAHFLREGIPIEECFAISKRPRAVNKMPFGKHKGMALTELPVSYLNWSVENLSAADIVSAMKRELKRRSVAA